MGFHACWTKSNNFNVILKGCPKNHINLNGDFWTCETVLFRVCFLLFDDSFVSAWFLTEVGYGEAAILLFIK